MSGPDRSLRQAVGDDVWIGREERRGKHATALNVVPAKYECGADVFGGVPGAREARTSFVEDRLIRGRGTIDA